MLSHIRAAIVTMALFTLLLGLGYPLAMTEVAGVIVPDQAGGSLVRDSGGRVVGSALIAQAFAQPAYFHPRPSAAGNGYDPTSSGASNLGPLDKKLIDRVHGDAAALSRENPGVPIPADAVTASGSGLDPDISPENAAFQTARVARARGLAAAAVAAVVAAHTDRPFLGFIGQPRVNVLAVNRDLDAHYPVGHSAAP
jgi:K+-transporting ATPase ATPase C chain